MALSGVVNNWPGTVEIAGFELAKNFVDHVKSYGVEIDEGWRAEGIETKKNYLVLTAKNAGGETKTEQAKAVIIATGIHPRRLGVPGEKEFDRKGVTYCTVCDGPLFRNKVTATIGAGNAALESAMMMAGIAKKVYLLSKYADTPENNGGFPRGETVLVEKIKQMTNVDIIYEAETTAVIGQSRVEALKYKIDGEETALPVEGVMVHIGQLPNSDCASVAKEKSGSIIVDAKCRTNVPGLFAAGDVTNIPYKQIAIAAGQGVVAALATIEYINRWK